MSMWSGISQIKQTLADEFQQASGAKKPSSDAVATIERNAKLLASEPAAVDDIIASLGDEPTGDERDGSNTNESAHKNEQKQPNGSSSTTLGTTKPDAKPDGDASSDTKPQADNSVTIASGSNSEEVRQNAVDSETSTLPKSPEATSDKNTDAAAADPPTEGAVTTTPAPAKTSDNKSEPEDDQVKADAKGRAERKGPTGATSSPSGRSSSPSPSLAQSTTQASRDGSPQADSALNAKLAKFAKYESMYPRLLRAYKDEKKRNELVKLYEKVLSEHTPCSSIAEPQALISYLNDMKSKSAVQHTEIGRISDELATINKQNTSLKQELSAANKEVSRLRDELESTSSMLKQVKEEKEKSVESARLDSELKSRVDLLESQLSVAEQARDASVKSLSTVRSQLDELNIRLKEAFAESESLREELHHSEQIAQERLEELTAVKAALRNREKNNRASSDKVDSQLSSVISEKELLESEVELLNKRIVRESEQLQLQIKSLKVRLQESEAHEEELRRQFMTQTHSQARAKVLEHQNTNTTSDLGDSEMKHNKADVEGAESAGAALAEAREAAANAAKANELLKMVHQDNALRIEKLQRSQKTLTADIEHLRHENSQLKKRVNETSASSSPSSGSAASFEEREKQQAYLKNVLLGFIEHKDQRKALMPVLATLLNLKNSETEQFMNGFA